MIIAAATIEVTQSATVLIVAGIGFVGTISATVLGVLLTTRYAGRAAKAATDAEKGIEAAKEAASRAQEAAADAAVRLVAAAKTADQRLDHIRTVVETTKTVADGVHLIVNNQHTLLLRRLALALEQVAAADPTDVAKQRAAAMAMEEVADAMTAAGLNVPAEVKSAADLAASPPAGDFPQGPV